MNPWVEAERRAEEAQRLYESGQYAREADEALAELRAIESKAGLDDWYTRHIGRKRAVSPRPPAEAVSEAGANRM